ADRVGGARRSHADTVHRTAVAEPKDLVGRPLDHAPGRAQGVGPVARGGDDPPIGAGDGHPDLGAAQVDSRNHLMKGSRSAAARATDRVSTRRVATKWACPPNKPHSGPHEVGNGAFPQAPWGACPPASRGPAPPPSETRQQVAAARPAGSGGSGCPREGP